MNIVFSHDVTLCGWLGSKSQLINQLTSSRSWLYYLYDMCTHWREITDQFPLLKKTVKIGLFSDTIKTSSFKVCIIITLHWVYIVILSLMTLSLFQGHRCVEKKKHTQIVFFRFCLQIVFIFLSIVVWWCMVATHIKRSSTVCFMWLVCI